MRAAPAALQVCRLPPFPDVVSPEQWLVAGCLRPLHTGVMQVRADGGRTDQPPVRLPGLCARLRRANAALLVCPAAESGAQVPWTPAQTRPPTAVAGHSWTAAHQAQPQQTAAACAPSAVQHPELLPLPCVRADLAWWQGCGRQEGSSTQAAPSGRMQAAAAVDSARGARRSGNSGGQAASPPLLQAARAGASPSSITSIELQLIPVPAGCFGMCQQAALAGVPGCAAVS